MSTRASFPSHCILREKVPWFFWEMIVNSGYMYYVLLSYTISKYWKILLQNCGSARVLMMTHGRHGAAWETTMPHMHPSGLKIQELCFGNGYQYKLRSICHFWSDIPACSFSLSQRHLTRPWQGRGSVRSLWAQHVLASQSTHCHFICINQHYWRLGWLYGEYACFAGT